MVLMIGKMRGKMKEEEQAVQELWWMVKMGSGGRKIIKMKVKVDGDDDDAVC